MNTSLIISSYSSMTKNEVVVNDKVVFSDPGKDFRDIFNNLYSSIAPGYPKFFKMDNLAKLGFLTSELLLRDAALSARYPGEETGIILMNSASSIDTDRRHQSTINLRDNYFPSPSVFVYTLPNIVIGEICIRHKLSGEGSFFVSENFDAEFLVTYVKELFNNDLVKCCIAGWIEFEEDDFQSLLFLVEKPDRTESGFINFEPEIIRNIYKKLS
jgi:hypothetical protein